jgi:hypothetical protein
MNPNIKIFLLCPVPEDQKPINEYIQLKENEFFNGFNLSSTKERKKISWLFFQILGGFSLLTGFQLESFPYFLEWLLLNFLLTFLFFTIFLLIQVARWKQIERRLKKSRLFYEEASWYDGQIWEKPFSILKNDKLLSTQKIRPFLQTIFRLLFTVFSLDVLFFVIFEIQ